MLLDSHDELKLANDALSAARQEHEIWRAGFRLLSVAILVASDYNTQDQSTTEGDDQQ